MTFIKGQIAWNKGKKFSAEACRKMSASKKVLALAPPNKILLDEYRLSALYKQGYGCNQLAQVFHVHREVIKRRVKKLGLSRTAEQACTSPLFRKFMADIRKKVLLSNPKELYRLKKLLKRKDVIAARLDSLCKVPTSIERLIYEQLDQRGINFEKQIIINGKFRVDVYLPKHRIIIECDGDYWHNLPRVKARDKSRNAYLKKCRYQVFHFWEHQIKQSPKKCLDAVFANI